jgi:type IV pilus assembly protein PilO
MPKSQIERLWVLGAAVVALLLLLIGYMMFISPQNSKTNSARSELSTAKMTNARLEARIAALREQAKDLPKYEADLKAAQLALPSTSGLPDFLRSLQSIGNATLTNVASLAVGNPTDVTNVAGASSPSTSSSSSSSSSSSNSSSSSTSRPSSSNGGLHVFALPITAQVTGSVSALDAFLTQLQTVQPRAVLISQLTESQGTNGAASGTSGASGAGATALELTMQAYVAPTGAVERAQLSAAAGK